MTGKNEIHLTIPTGSDGKPAQIKVQETGDLDFEYAVIFPNGDVDEPRYSTRQEAYNSMCEYDDILDVARRHFAEEGWEQDEIDIANYVSSNIEAMSEEAGYSIYPFIKGVK